MTITKNNIVAKAAVAVVAVAMAFTLVAPAAKAQDVSSMSLDQLVALVNSLQNQLSGSASANCSFTFTRALGQGSTGADVMNLQKFLNTSADTRVSVSGAGAPGMETSYYGPATAAAVSKFQVKYSGDILVPVGLTSPTGYFGPSSMAKANALCAAGGSTGGNNGGSTGGLNGGAGDIEVNQTSSGIEDEVMEGEEDVEVLGFDVEADGSDIEVTSVRVEFMYEGANTGSDQLDDYADEVTVWLDGDMVGSADLGEFDESDDVFSQNISIDGAVVREGDEGRFSVAVTAVNNVDSDDIGEDWEVALGQVRFKDATGATLTDTSGNGVDEDANQYGAISEVFTFEDLASTGDVELTVSEDDDEINDAHTIQVDSSSDTNDVEILSFTLEADGSDMELNQLIFDISSNGAGVTEIANDFRLMMGDEEVGTVRYDLDSNNSDSDHSTASSSDLAIALLVQDLDDDEVVIEEGETVSFTLVADINDIEGGFTNGDYIGASLAGNTTDVDADDENGDAVTDVSGSASSSNLSFASSGLMVKMTDSEATQVLNLDSSSGDDQGKFEMTFEVTAFEDTAYIELEAASSTDAEGSNVGAAFSIENATTGSVVAAGTSSSMVLERVSGGSVSGSFVRINANQTAVLKLTVYYDAAAEASYRLQLNEVGFSPTAATQADFDHATLPAEDFQSDSVQIKN